MRRRRVVERWLEARSTGISPHFQQTPRARGIDDRWDNKW
ncbi:hypothetical protein THTE_2603 [Thermogutta terrifontis]|uniref:Uncharacterized protein n=1 Tax=Thermogutta terrifontis TaxID=1331910 RepID=A0A286RGV6_9BACT|nr:hypothetical protein THTE_2603 [Thermogutta terrifontis]